MPLDGQAFAEVLLIIETAKRKTLTENEIRVWHKLASMKDWPLEAWQAAAVKLAYDPGDWPTFDKLAALAEEAFNGSAPSYGEAFERVMRAVRSYGWPFKDKLDEIGLTPAEIAAIGRCGGWDRFCECVSRDRGTLAAQFRDVYREQSVDERRNLRLPDGAKPKPAGLPEIKFNHELAKRITWLAEGMDPNKEPPEERQLSTRPEESE